MYNRFKLFYGFFNENVWGNNITAETWSLSSSKLGGYFEEEEWARWRNRIVKDP
jgi:hypothetical protein